MEAMKRENIPIFKKEEEGDPKNNRHVSLKSMVGK